MENDSANSRKAGRSRPTSRRTESSNSSTGSSVIKWNPVSPKNVIREITCLTCGCIGIHTKECSEDLLDSIKSCTGFVTLNVKSKHLNKDRVVKSAATSTRSSDSFVRKNFGYYNYDIDSSPQRQRKVAGIDFAYTGRKQDPSLITALNFSNSSSSSTSVAKESPVAVSCENFAASTDDCTSFECDQPSSNDKDLRGSESKGQLVEGKANQQRSADIAATPNMKTSPGKKPVRVHLLTGESILLVFDAKATTKDVFDQVCALHSIKESHFFGLSAFIENEHRFMDPKQRLNKYAPKEWGKELRRRDSDLSVQPSSIFTVQFQVQYFVEHPKLIRDPNSRHHYYLQLKKNLLQSKVPTQDEEVLTLAGISLHVDLAKFDPAVHLGRYFDPNDHVPAWFSKKWSLDYLWSHLPALHADMAATSTFEAEADYITRASCIDDVPVHYYKLYKTKREVDSSVILGIYHQGIRIHHVKDGTHLLDFEFPWAKVKRLFFTARRFDIYPEDQPASRKLSYYTGSQSRSKYLLRLLRETHSLYMSLTPFVQQVRKADGKQGRRQYRESYISGQDLEKMTVGGERLVGELIMEGDMSPASAKDKDVSEKLYKSYTSSTSHGSSHTSGIESDSKQRTEEEEDDNAFIDDFDPIERDCPQGTSSRGGKVIYVTQQHLEAPQHKSLSVTDLTEGSPSESTENVSGALAEPETSSESAKSEQTIKADVHDHYNVGVIKPSGPYEKEPESDVDEGYEQVAHAEAALYTELETLQSPNSNANSNNFARGELHLLETNTLPQKSATIRQSGTRKHESKRESTADQRSRTTSYESLLSDRSVASGTGVDDSHAALSASNSTPEYVTRPRRQGSRTYYDDTNTIFFGNERTKSSDLDYASSSQNSSGHPRHAVAVKPSSKHNNSGEGRKHSHHHHRSKKRNSSHMKRSGSIDSSLHNSGQQLETRAERRERKQHQRHQRHKSLQDSSAAAASMPDGPHFGGELTAKKSVDDLYETPARPLNRSRRHRDIPDTLNADTIYQQEEQQQIPREYHQRLSDAGHNTNAEQKRNHRHHDPQTRDGKHHSSGATVALANGNAGHTPRKHEVLLRTKLDKGRENRRRPVSYHLSTGPPPPPYFPQQGQKACYNDAALTSRPPVYMDSFKEVIV